MFCIKKLKYLRLSFRSYCIKVTKDVRQAIKAVEFGQPTPHTHPHLLKPGEVTPSITKSEFQERRQRLVESVVKYATRNNKNLKHHVVVIPSATKQYMSGKIPYVFRQNSDFMYLSGCLEPDSCLVLSTTASSGQHFSILFLRNKDPLSEMWDGPRTAIETAPSFFGTDNSLPMSEFEHYLASFLRSNKSSSLWYDFMNPTLPEVHRILCEFLNKEFNQSWVSPKQLIHEMRLIKSRAEVELMQKSCDIASEAIIKTMKTSRPGISEHEIFAKVDYECRVGGAEYLAYPPVVAGGSRATIIHYINNNQIVKGDEMVLVDAGCEYHGYSSDITRTWPVSGKFTPEQQELYEIILCVQTELIGMCYEFSTLDSLFNAMCISLGTKLQEIGLAPRSASREMLTRLAYQFCPHHVSHYLGMDVHDTPLIERNIKIKPGMVITVEPGIYINQRHKVPERYQNLGIRIEDDVLITDHGPLVLSRNCPKFLDDIERLTMQR